MKIIRDFDACPSQYKGAVLALGNFDGVHLGHQAILKQCVELARAKKCPAAAMTFEPHPREFFAKRSNQPTDNPLRLYSFRRKAELLKDAGIDVLFAARFNAALAATSAQDFIHNILGKKLGAHHVVTGDNFAFGKGRGGTVDMLANAPFKFTAVPAIKNAHDEMVSSSAIRHALAKGDVATARAMLGHDYEISGHVMKGDARGRSIGFPTANFSLHTLFRPRFGVYAVRLTFADGTRCPGVANLGIRPTFSAHEPLLEAHAFGMTRMFYGEHVRVALLHFIRDEKKFAGVEELRAQIAEDCKIAQQLIPSPLEGEGQGGGHQ